jgi:excisionase family DNA binding protein
MSLVSATLTTVPIMAQFPRLFEPLLTVPEAARLLHMHPKTLQIMARDGRIPSVRIGKPWLFRESDLDAWVRSKITSPQPTAPVNGVIQ